MPPKGPKPNLERYDETLWRGPWVQALCIGVDAYAHLKPLNNAVADVVALAAAIQDLPGMSRACGPEQVPRCKNPATKASLECVLKTFVAPLVSAPPRIVMVFFAGHGIRVGGNMYLVPAKADLNGLADLQQKCLSQHELFGLLKTELEDKILVKDVLFLVILDMCQNLPKFLSTQHGNDIGAHLEGLEPYGSSRPRHWALCTSTANGTKAPDGSAGHSPFLQELLSVECGFLEQNVSVKFALEMVHKRLLDQDGQEPCLFPGNLGEICLYGPSTSISRKCDVFICHRLGTETREIAEELHDLLRKMTIKMKDAGSRHIEVFFETSKGNALQKDQIADALCSSTVIVLLVSQSTFNGICNLSPNAPVDGALTQLLVQYEMALEIYEQRSDVTVFPLLLGKKTPGESVYDNINCSDECQMSTYWPVHAVPENLKVQSIMRSALAGLRRDFNVAQNLASKKLKTGVPSILQSFDGKLSTASRTIKQTLTACSSTENFRPHIFYGNTKDAVQTASKHIQEIVTRHLQDVSLGPHQHRGRRRCEVECADGARKISKKSHDGDCSGKQSASTNAEVAEAPKSAHTNYHANEGSSSSVKRQKSDSSSTSAGASIGGGVAGATDDHQPAVITGCNDVISIESIESSSAGKEAALLKPCNLPSLKRFNGDGEDRGLKCERCLRGCEYQHTSDDTDSPSPSSVSLGICIGCGEQRKLPFLKSNEDLLQINAEGILALSIRGDTTTEVALVLRALVYGEGGAREEKDRRERRVRIGHQGSDMGYDASRKKQVWEDWEEEDKNKEAQRLLPGAPHVSISISGWLDCYNDDYIRKGDAGKEYVFKILVSLAQQRTLVRLRLHNCLIRSLPVSLGNLTDLKSLEISECDEIQEFPGSVGRISCLQSFAAMFCARSAPDGCDIFKFFESIKTLPEMKTLQFKSCAMSDNHVSSNSIWDFRHKMTKLENLKIEGSHSYRFPLLDLSNIYGLKRLALDGIFASHVDFVTAIHATSSSLTELSLRLPWGLGGESSKGRKQIAATNVLPICSALKSFSLTVTCENEEDLKFTESYALISDKFIPSVTYLQLCLPSEGKYSTILPSALGTLDNLTTLEIKGNQWFELPATMGFLTNLTDLKFTSFESDHQHGGGCIHPHALPAWLAKLTNLRKLGIGWDTEFVHSSDTHILLPVAEVCVNSFTSLDSLVQKYRKSVFDHYHCYALVSRSGPKEVTEKNVIIISYPYVGTFRGFGEMEEEIKRHFRSNGFTLDAHECTWAHDTNATRVQIVGSGVDRAVLERLLDGSGEIDNTRVCHEVAVALKHLEIVTIDGGCRMNDSQFQSVHVLHPFPSWIDSLSQLKRFEVNRVKCQVLPFFLAKLTSLEVLKIGSDVLQVDYIDGELSMIKNVPSEVLYKGLKAVQQYLGDLQEGSTPCFLLKCVVVGNQRSGKSSVVDSLVGNTHKLRHDNDRTVGIDVRRWVLQQNVVNNRQLVSKSLLVNFYDSGGHLVYRSTHGLFMRGDPLFLNMVRSDMSEDMALEALVAWVEEIHQQMLNQKVRYSPKIGLVFTVTGEMDTVELNHNSVLDRLKDKMNSQAKSVHFAMRALEDEIQRDGSLCEKWVALRNNRNATLKRLDEYALKGANWPIDRKKKLDRSSVSVICTAESDLIDYHSQMQTMEKASKAISEIYLKDLQRLRRHRISRPRILFTRGVSCKTGEGLETLKESIADLVTKDEKETNFFPHVGSTKPLIYLALERLAQEGRVAKGAEEGKEKKCGEWELAVSTYIQEHVSPNSALRRVCEEPRVSLTKLQSAWEESGMEKSQLIRALQFLHDTGSVLFYDENNDDSLHSHKRSSTIKDLVILQPAWIIDAAKYVIHEREDVDLDNLLRALESNIREKAGNVMNAYYEQFKTTGILQKDLLLTYLWDSPRFPPDEIELLLDLFQEFKLLRPINEDEFFVPAMLSTKELSEKYVQGNSKWWLLPSFAVETACNFSGTGIFDDRPAVLRRVYTVIVGSLPFSFMPELQFALSEIENCNSEHQENFCPEDRSLAGTVLSETYKIEKDGLVREYVIVSTPSSSEMKEKEMGQIRVLALVKIIKPGSLEGTMDWRLFKKVTNTISKVVGTKVNLSISERAIWVNMAGEKSEQEVIKMTQDSVLFRFEAGQDEDVPKDLVMPTGQEQKVCIRNIGAGAYVGESVLLDSRISNLFADAQLASVCEKVCTFFGIVRVSDMAFLTDKDLCDSIPELQLKTVDFRRLEVLVRKVRVDGGRIGSESQASGHV